MTISPTLTGFLYNMTLTFLSWSLNLNSIVTYRGDTFFFLNWDNSEMYADLIFMILSYFKNNITFIICICVVCVHLSADVLMCVCLPPPFLRESLSLNTTSGSSVSAPYFCPSAGIIDVCCYTQLLKWELGNFI